VRLFGYLKKKSLRLFSLCSSLFCLTNNFLHCCLCVDSTCITPLLYSLIRWRSYTATQKIRFCARLSNLILPNVHTLCSIPVLHVQFCTLLVDKSNALNASRIVSHSSRISFILSVYSNINQQIHSIKYKS